MQATSGEQNIVDIGLKVKVNQEIIPSIAIPLRHITVSKASIAEEPRTVKKQKLLVNTEACIDEIVNETAVLISSCYGFEKNNMTQCRINS